MNERLKISVVYGISALFVMLNMYLVYKEMYWGILIPLGVVMFILFIFSLDKVLLLAVFATPLTINLGDYDLGVSISVPSEPLLIGILLLLILKFLLESSYEKKLLKHPVSIAIFIYLSWMLVCTLTSDIPLVSIKYLISRLWFIVPVYFGGLMLFREKKNIRKFIWAYVAGLLIVIIYTTYIHMGYAFSEKSGHWVMQPFYNDHTAYGVILALFIPVMAGIIFDNVVAMRQRLLALAALAVLFTALYLSFSRAAWASVGLTFGVFIVVMLRIRFRWFAITVAGLLLLFFTFKFEILDKLEKNKQDASANFIEHVQSISNISSDASNLERINRWQAAIRMYNERPLTGWGPGTYQFEYAPFQRAKEKTIISTNLGDMGNAHSEYIGPLSEMGLPGMFSVIILMIAIIYTGLQVYRKSTNRQTKIIALSITLGLISYYVHGTMNNFLDTDKASVPFWGFLAILVALDTYYLGDAQQVKSGTENPGC